MTLKLCFGLYRFPTRQGLLPVRSRPTLGRASAWLLMSLLMAWGVPGAGSAQEPLDIPMVYLTKLADEPLPLSLVEPIIEDKGLGGARKGIVDNATTGQFLKQSYSLTEELVPEDGDLIAAVQARLAEGHRLFIADLHADELLAVADLPEAADALIFNVRATDDGLRREACRANLWHAAPSRAMKADALAQYLVLKKWRDWFLVHGTGAGDLAFTEALRRAAKRFGAKIVEERAYEYVAGSRRSDSGHAQVQKQMAVFTQEPDDDYDVLVVADESDVFGEYLPYRLWDPRPVVGTQGLVPTAWHRSHEQWGGTQMQRRFTKFAGRIMVERDFSAWVAVRAVGEAVTRIATADTAKIKAYLLSEPFKVAAFKGEGLTFRPWNQQLRQPMLLAAPRALVSVSPQDGFLHQRTPLDTLGYDEPDSECRLN